MTEARVRAPAVAGSFYPAEPAHLETMVRRFLAEATSPQLPAPRLLIVPHAGYVYSGSVAASAYTLLEGAERVRRAILVGPSHFVGFPGLAHPDVTAFATPLGDVPLDRDLEELLQHVQGIKRDAGAHAREHSLEVQLPFLQVVRPGVTVLPLLTGDDDPAPATEALEEALTAPDVVGVVSSDLSHYHNYASAQRLDTRTADAIEHLRHSEIGPMDACGGTAVRAALRVARNHDWSCRQLDLRNSGDTAGPRDQVVGYGAFALGPSVH